MHVIQHDNAVATGSLRHHFYSQQDFILRKSLICSFFLVTRDDNTALVFRINMHSTATLLDTHVQLLINANMQLASHLAPTLGIQACRHVQEDLLKFNSNREERWLKWLVGATRATLFQKPPLCWDFLIQLSLGFTENGPKKRKYPMSVSWLRGKKWLVDASLQKRMARLFRSDSKGTVIQITTG